MLLEPVGRGDKLTVRFRNTGAGANTVRAIVSVP